VAHAEIYKFGLDFSRKQRRCLLGISEELQPLQLRGVVPRMRGDL
jgi:hypothetical protein